MLITLYKQDVSLKFNFYILHMGYELREFIKLIFFIL